MIRSHEVKDVTWGLWGCGMKDVIFSEFQGHQKAELFLFKMVFWV